MNINVNIKIKFRKEFYKKTIQNSVLESNQIFHIKVRCFTIKLYEIASGWNRTIGLIYLVTKQQKPHLLGIAPNNCPLEPNVLINAHSRIRTDDFSLEGRCVSTIPYGPPIVGFAPTTSPQKGGVFLLYHTGLLRAGFEPARVKYPIGLEPISLDHSDIEATLNGNRTHYNSPE